jgi:hypothetical protein
MVGSDNYDDAGVYKLRMTGVDSNGRFFYSHGG